MLPELGHAALLLALLFALLQGSLPLLGAQRGQRVLMQIAIPAAWMQLLLTGLAYLALTIAFVWQDFSVEYVANNSNTLLPLAYRYTAVWGSHEGSLLLWALMLSGWNAATALCSGQLPETVRARVLGVIGLVAVGFLSFMLFTSNPFARLLPAPLEGHDLNPLLQDPGMIIHPPMLYIGYIGFVVPFAFAIAGLLDGHIDNRWLRWTRPWTNAAWGFLTFGILLGSWWAYYELGWGGWWFWDPVENASFMPWLAGAALIHSQAVTEKRGSFTSWTLLLAIATFSLSLLGAFLVRSGVLTSVHSFAADPARGLFILAFLAIVIGGSLLLYLFRAPQLEDGKPFAPASRETLLLINNLLLTSACAMVLVGTLYPLLADALDLGKISVGPPYFGSLFIVLMAPLVLLVPFGPLTRWQREQVSKPMAMLWPWAGLAVVIGIIAYVTAPQGALKTATGVAGAMWVGIGTLRYLWNRLRGNNKRLTPETLGMVFAHLGIAVFLIGALLVEAQETQRELPMQAGQRIDMGRYSFRFDGVERVRGPNYMADRGQVEIFRDGQPYAVLHPEKRAYASGGQVMTDAGIKAGLTADLFVALGEPLDRDTGTWAVRLQVKPFVRWIWAGAFLMAIGGFVTAFDRRFRRPVAARTPREVSA